MRRVVALFLPTFPTDPDSAQERRRSMLREAADGDGYPGKQPAHFDFG